MKNTLSLLLLSLLFVFSCKQASKFDLSPFGETGIRMVVEIPAGTNHKIEMDQASGEFKKDYENAPDQIVDFLPYPGNFGFIPGTRVDKSKNGGGDALDVLLVSETLPPGTVVEVKPIATLLLKEGEAIDAIVIAVPADSTKQVFQASSFSDLMIAYQPAKRMMEDWFLNYQRPGKVELLGWRDEKYALSEIKKWLVVK